MASPLGWQKTGLRLEYSLVTKGTYTYYDPFYEHAYRGRSLAHWLGPDGDDFYVELTRLLGESATLQLSYSYTRKGQGSFGQPEGGSPGLFLTGVVERRHSLGIRLHKIHSPSLETHYWLELASVSNRGNVPGAGGLDAQAGLAATYRWPVSQPPLTPERAGGGAKQPSVADSTGGKIGLRTWSASVRSDRGLPAQPTAFFLGVDHRTNFGRWPVSFSVDGTPRGDHLFWSADVHYPLAVAPYGAASVFAGLGGGRFPGGVGPLPETVAFAGPRGGLEFRYQVPLRAAPHSLYLAGRVSTNLRWTFAQVYLWDYSLGAGWKGPGLGVEIGYRGIAALWQPRTPDQTSLLWEGIYLTVSIR